MTSINPILNSMLDSYREAMGLEESDLPMNPCFERWLLDAWKLGLNPEGIRICIEERLKFNRKNQCRKGCELKHLVRSEDDVAVVLNEIAVFKASQRVKVYAPNKAQALRDVGLPDEPPTPEAKPAKDVLANYINAMNKAVEDATRKAQ